MAIVATFATAEDVLIPVHRTAHGTLMLEFLAPGRAPLTIAAASIVAVTPQPSSGAYVHVAGVQLPFRVEASYDDVLAAWEAAT